jgi:serine/threonine protein kinase
VDDKKRPTGGPPPMPDAGPPTMPAAVVTGGPPPMPAAGPPTPTSPTQPSAAFPRMPGTVQMPFGAAPGEGAAPIMPTITGAPLPDVAPPALPPPDRYELGPEIARGGMGRVVEATDTRLGRIVALKEVLAMDPDVLRRFARETRITARLEHPSIVPLHDAGTTPGGAPYYVMRKISGRPLEHLVAKADTLSQRLALVPHIVAAAQAIAHAHARGIVHRDIKPSNILVGELGETIVIDWGLAKAIGEPDEPGRIDLSASVMAAPAISSVAAKSTGAGGAEPPLDTEEIKTRAGIVFGTPGFMAPEQLRGHPVTERCDVYALGATLYHMLSRKPPHHAKTADEMMQAAARHPPTPIAALVPGVPAELSTIVDKALAFDPAQRYPDARALAEDLQRFLTGQLVASHRYSPRERVVRFVRRHRVPVIVSAVATLTLLVGGTIAVSRIVNARDRAEVARREAELNAERATLEHARSEIERNPTHAVAMVKPLAEKYWPEVRMIAAAARAHGVAYGLPAAKETASLELSRDGARALAGGDDGAVRIYELGPRTARAIPTGLGGPVAARFADEERRVVAWQGRDRELAIIDLAGAGPRRVTAPGKIVNLEVAGTTAYWVDDQQKLWALDLAAAAGAAPAEVPVPEPIEKVAPSPDGRFIALLGQEHLLFLDRAQPGAAPIELMTGVTRAFDWSTDGTEFGAIVNEEGVLGTVEDGPHIMQRNFAGPRSHVVHANKEVYVLGPTGVGIIRRDPAPRKQFEGAPVALREARGGVVVAGSRGRILVVSPYGDRTLTVPTGKLEHVEASPRSPYVVGAIEGRLLVWNLDDVEPRRVGDPRPGPMQLVGADRAIVEFAGSGTQWLDLATGEATPLGEWSLASAAAAPSGQLALAIDDQQRAHLIRPGQPVEPLDGKFDVAGFATDDDLLLGNGAAGTVHLHDPRSGRITQLAAPGGKLLDLAWNRARPAWAAALFGDRTLWRRNLATGAEATTADVRTTGHLQVARDGTVLFADGRAIRAWRPGGAVEPQAELPRRIATIGLAGPDHLLAILDDDSTWLVDLRAPGRIEETEGVGTSARVAGAPGPQQPQEPAYLSMAQDTGTLVVPNSGGIDVVDALAHRTWTLAVQPPAPSLYVPSTARYANPRISTDGSRVLARLVGTRQVELVTWSIPVPKDGAETARWVDSLTNAAIAAGRSRKLTWRD